MEVSYLDQGIAITQQKFATDLLRDSGISTFKKVVTPLPLNLKLHSTDAPLYSNPTHYRSLVGKLNFLTHTRPNLAFTVQTLSQFMQHPTKAHYKALTHTLNYLASTVGRGILLKASKTSIGVHVWILGVLLVVTFFSLAIPLLVGSPKSSLQYPNPPLKQNIVPCLSLTPKSLR